ncbi:iron ABC transporter substrate-binding protein [Fodinibius sediminis]|nr:iron ABC transporter substrate-binding protein [Fodinibius sediminis]
MKTIKKVSRLTAAVAAVLLLVSCSEPATDQLVIYSGRSQALVDQLVTDFKQQTGIDVEVRYGNDAELLAVMNEEGGQSPADLYWANTMGAMAIASKQNLLKPLPDSLLNKPAAFKSSSDEWIPVTVRYRVLAYNANNVDSTQLPTSVMDLPGMSEFEGRVGWTPTYSSFYDFLTTVRLTQGDEEARRWLLGMMQLDPKSYSSNTPMVQAIAAGEIDIALTNHYYILRLKYGGGEGEYEDHEHYGEAEPNANAPIKTYHFEEGDLGNLALVTGAAELQTSQDSEAAQKFLGFLLSRQAQEYAAESVHEYPVIDGVTLPDYMLNLERAFKLSPEYDYEKLQQLEGTLNLLREVGVI